MKCWRKFSMVSHNLSYRSKLICCMAVFFMVSIMSLLLGSVDLSAGKIVQAIGGKGDEAILRIFLYVRLPRTLAAMLAGCALSASGVIIQSVMGNPLAGPNLIGVNAGAGLGAVICAAFAPGLYRALPLAAFVGAFAAMLMIYLFAAVTGASRITLVLAGIAISSIIGAGIDAIITMVPDAMVSVNSFRIGSVSGVAMEDLYLPGICILAGMAILFLFCHEMDVLSLGEETASSLGLSIRRYRFLFLLMASVLAGAAVSFCGLLGFVGLIVPNVARYLVGSESRCLFPASVLFGGAFVMLCDILARVLFAPYEVPVGIIMSFLGGPFFLWLLVRRKGGHGGNA